jgi:hypothetical protein
MKYILDRTKITYNNLGQPTGTKDYRYTVSDDLPDLKKQYEKFIKRDDCYSATISIPIISTDHECDRITVPDLYDMI